MGEVTEQRRGWWRSNAAALIALAVLLPATVLGAAWWEWKHAFPDSSQPLWAVDAGESGTVDLADSTWGPIKSKALTDTTGLDVPKDSTVILVGIDVTPHSDKGTYCVPPRLVEQRSGREWATARLELGVQYNSDEPETCVTFSKDEKAKPYQLVLPYVVPDDAKGPYWVVIEPNRPGSEYVRFSIDP